MSQFYCISISWFAPVCCNIAPAANIFQSSWDVNSHCVFLEHCCCYIFEKERCNLFPKRLERTKGPQFVAYFFSSENYRLKFYPKRHTDSLYCCLVGCSLYMHFHPILCLCVVTYRDVYYMYCIFALYFLPFRVSY